MSDSPKRGRKKAPPGLGDDALVRNAGDREQLRKAKKKEVELETEELDDVRILLQSVEFRRFLWRHMAHCRTFESIWHADPYQHAFNSGVRDAGSRVLSLLLEADPDAFILMMSENNKDPK